jgi:hypothetical protein
LLPIIVFSLGFIKPLLAITWYSRYFKATDAHTPVCMDAKKKYRMNSG